MGTFHHFNPFQDQIKLVKRLISNKFEYSDILKMMTVLSRALLKDESLLTSAEVLDMGFECENFQSLRTIIYAEAMHLINSNSVEVLYIVESWKDLDIKDQNQLLELMDFCNTHLKHASSLLDVLNQFSAKDAATFLAVVGLAIQNEITFDEAYDILYAHIPDKTSSKFDFAKKLFSKKTENKETRLNYLLEGMTIVSKRLQELRKLENWERIKKSCHAKDKGSPSQEVTQNSL